MESLGSAGVSPFRPASSWRRRARRDHRSGRSERPAHARPRSRPVRGGACPRAQNFAPQPCIRQGPSNPNHDAVIRIGGEAPRRRIHSFSRHRGHRGATDNATSNGIGEPWVRCAGTLKPDAGKTRVIAAHAAARSVMPSGTEPVVAKRHNAMSNFRASATIIFLRVPAAFCVRA